MTSTGNSAFDKPLVSVITVVYNGVNGIEETVLSVLSQSYPNVEYLVIDGGSTDGTLQILEKYRDRIDILLSETDKGIYDAMNKGIGLASGRWINFMNSGDRFASDDVLELFNEPFEDTDIIYGDAIKLYPTFQTVFKKFPLPSVWREMPFSHQAAFVSASLMKNFRFDTSYKLSADYDFIYKAYAAGKTFVYVNRIICLVDFREGASKNFSFDSVYERKRSSLHHDFSVLKQLYYSFYILYVKFKVYFKKQIGDKPTAWITRLLRT